MEGILFIYTEYSELFMRKIGRFLCSRHGLLNGVLVNKLEGTNPAELAQKVSELTGLGDGQKKTSEIEEITDASKMNGSAVSTNDSQAGKGELLQEKLKSLVASKPVMLLMKGSPNEPKCGRFNHKVVEILKDLGVEIGSFDFLANEAARQGLKSFSNWPTYPQLYIAGEFIGGCDIVTEMYKSGELKELLMEKGMVHKESLESRLKSLINSSPTTLFIKGSPDAPRCGFNSKVMSILGYSFWYL
ncbi:hypothetical protein GOP47_0028569 [Adiantum capillus-veneris]|nr:hypothetical protein GOP47_0028569 [Adiantum capillus-veneris]